MLYIPHYKYALSPFILIAILPHITMSQLSIHQLSLFASIVKCLREYIGWHEDHGAAVIGIPRPVALPVAVIKFCADALEVQSNIVVSTWEALGDTLWTPHGDELPDETSSLIRDAHLLGTFLTHSVKHKLGLHTILPPVRTCLDIRCETITADGKVIPQALSKLESYEATLFTRDMGPIPAWSASAHCRSKYYGFVSLPFIFTHHHSIKLAMLVTMQITIFMNQANGRHTTMA